MILNVRTKPSVSRDQFFFFSPEFFFVVLVLGNFLTCAAYLIYILAPLLLFHIAKHVQSRRDSDTVFKVGNKCQSVCVTHNRIS